MMRHLTAIVLAWFAVTGMTCSRAVTVACPHPTEWTEGQQAEAADELLTLPPGSVLVDMMLDYARERAALRACQ